MPSTIINLQLVLDFLVFIEVPYLLHAHIPPLLLLETHYKF